MDIIAQAQARREKLLHDLSRIEAFLATAFELQQELSGAKVPTHEMSDAEKASAPKRVVMRRASAGVGQLTVEAAIEALKQNGAPMSTRELLPIIRSKGIEVGGRDVVATLSARFSNSALMQNTNGKWWFVEEIGTADIKEAADIPTEEQSAASLFHQTEGANDAAALA